MLNLSEVIRIFVTTISNKRHTYQSALCHKLWSKGKVLHLLLDKKDLNVNYFKVNIAVGFHNGFHVKTL